MQCLMFHIYIYIYIPLQFPISHIAEITFVAQESQFLVMAEPTTLFTVIFHLSTSQLNATIFIHFVYVSSEAIPKNLW